MVFGERYYGAGGLWLPIKFLSADLYDLKKLFNQLLNPLFFVQRLFATPPPVSNKTCYGKRRKH